MLLGLLLLYIVKREMPILQNIPDGTKIHIGAVSIANMKE